MDARKVLEMGGGTLLISLPKSWARRNGSAKGGSVLVEEMTPDRLIVRPLEGEKETRTATISYPRESISYVINDITGAYFIGDDVIKVAGTQAISREDRERVKAAIRRLVGLEIMDEDSKSITLQFLPEPSTLDPEKIVRRMGSLTKGMLRDAREALASADSKAMTLIAERDDEVDRLYFLMVRAIRTATIDPEIARRYGLSPVECLDYRVLASFVESLGDTIGEFSSRAAEEPPAPFAADGTAQILRILEEMEETSLRAFLGRKNGLSRKGHVQVDSMHQDIIARIRKIAHQGGASTAGLLDLFGLLERMSKTFVDISDLALPTYRFGDESRQEGPSKSSAQADGS
jgi:phosphate uptake regulator